MKDVKISPTKKKKKIVPNAEKSPGRVVVIFFNLARRLRSDKSDNRPTIGSEGEDG